MNSFTSWLKPTLLGPQASTWFLTTVGSIVVGMHALSGGRFDNWVTGMLVASFWAAGLGVLLITTDVLLLKMKWRQLPTGARAWTSSLLSPFFVFFFWRFVPPPESVIALAFFLLLPMAAGAFTVRMIFGTRPSAS